ncbi:F-box/kelch-repeat protein SKIP11-like isoform X2 [Syzygium oleosum]|uniref:F-box/kelch-repeat protein SKIP11-like isoform X2 n=1 Tax=Syzygium oleosum TaxID=219896 RepID=UPI0011D23C6A|nr:F-box/kelch-repeat protein SKIP11-like isoform X2 [Syzygium oleosum]
MLEGRSCLVSRMFSSSCRPETNWSCKTCRLEVEIRGSKRLPGADVEDYRRRKSFKLFDLQDETSWGWHGKSDGRSVFDAGNAEEGLLYDDTKEDRKQEEGSVCQAFLCEESDNQRHAGDSSHSNSLINSIGRDMSINCLIRCARSDYGSIASLNRSFRSLINTGGMNAPRCLFGSASLGEIAIVAGGQDPLNNILSSAEMYNSETHEWHPLPSMHKPRKMCSAVFMDGKFYVIGGIGGSEGRVLTCGEEYDIKTGRWTEIPDMSPGRETDIPASAEAPPLVAVVNNELYSADYANMEVRKYDKVQRMWFPVGRLPESAASTYGWGLAFRACGDSLIVIGGPQNFIELNSWVPSEGPPMWNLLARKRSSNFVYNCAVMGC